MKKCNSSDLEHGFHGLRGFSQIRAHPRHLRHPRSFNVRLAFSAPLIVHKITEIYELYYNIII